MLYYVLIEKSEGVDNTEGQDIVFSTKLLSKECNTCHFYYYIRINFKYERNNCDGCYHCRIYQNENKNLVLRIVKLEKGTYRTVSNYFYDEVVELLKKTHRQKNFGWLYKEDLETKNFINKDQKVPAE